MNVIEFQLTTPGRYVLRGNVQVIAQSTGRLVLEVLGQSCEPIPLATSCLTALDSTSLIAPERLTPRELSAIQLVAEGLSNKEIAIALKVGEKTVKSHLAAAFSKLGVQSRTQAAMVAIFRGIVASPGLPPPPNEPERTTPMGFVRRGATPRRVHRGRVAGGGSPALAPTCAS
jgi:DNA-binding CsgD family transcriptional regulator